MGPDEDQSAPGPSNSSKNQPGTGGPDARDALDAVQDQNTQGGVVRRAHQDQDVEIRTEP